MSAAPDANKTHEATGAAAVPLHFLLAGFSKCGTTTLHGLLSEHPELYMPGYPRKEPWFFSHNYERGWRSYTSLFKDAYRGQKLGEASTSYTTFEREVVSRRRILEHYPNIKLILIARDPVDRIESAFRETHHSGASWGMLCPFQLERALQRLPVLLADSSFNQRLRNYTRHMPREQIKVVLLEDLKADPESVLRTCFDFLDVDPDVRITRTRRQLNAGNIKLRDSRELRKLRNLIWSPETGEPLGRISPKVADQFLYPLGYRKPFTSNMVEWTDEARRLVASTIFEDASDFLDSIDKPLDTWPRLHQLAKTHGLVKT